VYDVHSILWQDDWRWGGVGCKVREDMDVTPSKSSRLGGDNWIDSSNEISTRQKPTRQISFA